MNMKRKLNQNQDTKQINEMHTRAKNNNEINRTADFVEIRKRKKNRRN